MGKISQIPPLLRPREKAMRYGIKSLSDVELVALIISSGTKNHSALEISETLLGEGGLTRLKEFELADYTRLEGISKVTAVKLSAVIEIAKRYNIREAEIESTDNIPDLIMKYQKLFKGESQEHLVVISFTKSGSVIRETDLYKGTIEDMSASPREVLSEVLKRNADRFLLIHNHPSGNLTPSDADIHFTEMILEQSYKLNLRLIDHVIVSDTSYFSFLHSDGTSPKKEREIKKDLPN
ncbi:MAG: DNA repair protein RadC [Coprobacillus sp.]|nr:DNA repair protein RadC [Coprobacillus sp.]